MSTHRMEYRTHTTHREPQGGPRDVPGGLASCQGEARTCTEHKYGAHGPTIEVLQAKRAVPLRALVVLSTRMTARVLGTTLTVTA